MKVENGVMVMKDGKAWGVVYQDGNCTSYGWIAPERALIHDPRYCKQPTDVTCPGSHYLSELNSAELVIVRRTTTVEIIDGKGGV